MRSQLLLLLQLHPYAATLAGDRAVGPRIDGSTVTAATRAGGSGPGRGSGAVCRLWTVSGPPGPGRAHRNDGASAAGGRSVGPRHEFRSRSPQGRLLAPPWRGR